MYKLHLEKAEKPEIKSSTFIGSWRKQGNYRKTSTSVSLTTLKPLIMCVKTNWKILKKWEHHTTLPAFLETCMWVKKQQLEPDMELQTWNQTFQIGKGVCQGCILLLCLLNL